MDEIRFVNEYTRDEGCTKEIYKFWFFKRPLIRILFWYFASMELLALVNILFNPIWSTEWILVGSYFFIFCGLMYFAYRAQVRAVVKRDRELAAGRELVCTTEISDSEITIFALDSKQTLSFDIMKYAFLTKSYIVLVTRAKHMIIFKKDGFAKGSCDEFVAYLKARGIKIKGKG